MFQSVGYERGLHLRGSPLWFDAERRRELCVLTGIERRLPPCHRRVVASAPLAAALQGAGYAGNILPTPWGRWMGIAGFKVQLIDGGGPPGAALALVDRGDEVVLMAGMLRARAVQWPTAAHLVVRLPAALHSGQPLRDVALQVAHRVEALLAAGQRPGVWVDHLEVGLALHAEMALLGQPLQPRALLAKMAGAPAPQAARRPPLALGSGREGGATDIRIDSGMGLWAATPADEGLLPVRWFADLTTLRTVIVASKAKQVSLVGLPPAAEGALDLPKGVRLRLLGEARQLALTEQPLA